VPEFGNNRAVADNFDLRLLNAVQRDDSRTADSLSEELLLSPSALARRLRRLRSSGIIERSVALLSPKVRRHRLQAILHVQLREHAAEGGLEKLRRDLVALDEVQACWEVSGAHDMIVLVDCRDMEAFNALADRALAEHPAIRRYETSFVKREVKYAPFVALDGRDLPLIDALETGS
jgi:DNA-binding Lrp family transcriptional regulator